MTTRRATAAGRSTESGEVSGLAPASVAEFITSSSPNSEHPERHKRNIEIPLLQMRHLLFGIKSNFRQHKEMLFWWHTPSLKFICPTDSAQVGGTVGMGLSCVYEDVWSDTH